MTDGPKHFVSNLLFIVAALLMVAWIVRRLIGLLMGTITFIGLALVVLALLAAAGKLRR